MLYAQPETLQDLNIGIKGNQPQAEECVRKWSSPYPWAPRSPAVALSECYPFIISMEFGHIIWPEQRAKPKLFSLRREKKFINETYFTWGNTPRLGCIPKDLEK